uniref:Protein-glutamine gamma-glutamyltransferase 2 n=1 Tax=Takifugu rubripes TaxID=31033 RepID=A0A674MLG2_TAKRU
MRLHCDTNNVDHHTSEASQDQLIVRRGQTFRLTLELTHPFQQKLHPLAITATTGPQPSEKQGTRAYLRIPALDPASTSAKAVWKMELDQSSSVSTGVVQLMVTPPADAPVGAYSLTAEHRGESAPLGRLVLLFNPWCPDDDVFLDDEEKRGEYVMNEEGVIYKGSGKYITSMKWDYGQFEDNMVDICLKLLDMSHKHLEDPAEDVSARCDPAYVGRVVSAMINSQDDNGVLKGQWSGPYFGGVTPSHWNGSHDILEKWFNIGCHPVKYGQCWVFAGVMCSVMRFLGIPCRVVTNYNSAHDTNGNLIVDVYHADYGVREKRTRDSIWNFHVWVEGWMRRPDLGDDGRFDGWQVLDPTPQEMSGGVYCCGPAPVKAIHDGEVHLDYDVPFVFAAVNADCVDWLVKADGSHVNIWADTKRVGHNISTKSVGSDKRRNITDTYKHGEGASRWDRCLTGGAQEIHTDVPLQEQRRREQSSSTPAPGTKNGKDVNLKLVVTSNTSVALQLSINITVQAMRHNGTPAVNILSEVTEETLQPWKGDSSSTVASGTT